MNPTASDSVHMDGVLVDVTLPIAGPSKRPCVFSGKGAMFEEIQPQGERGHNNDWDLTEAILVVRDERTEDREIVEKTQSRNVYQAQGRLHRE